MSLTSAAVTSKKVFFGIILLIAFVTAGVFFLGIGRQIKNIVLPPKPPPASVAFGKLPVFDLSGGLRPTNVVYSLETISGDFPDLPDKAKVFAITNVSSSFGDLEHVKNRASQVGFGDEPLDLGGGIVRFTDDREEGKTLTIDMVSGNFNLETNFLNNVEILSTRPESEDIAKKRATDFLSQIEFNLDEFSEEKIQTRMMRIDGSNLTEIPAIANANLVEVNFVRPDLDKIPIFWPKDDESSVSVLVSQSEVVRAKVDILPLMKNKFATYPLKGAAAAFEDLKAQKAAVNTFPKTSSVSILDVSLGYIESKKNKQSFSSNTEFLQPVYVFKGQDDFLAFVPAVDDVWIR